MKRFVSSVEKKNLSIEYFNEWIIVHNITILISLPGSFWWDLSGVTMETSFKSIRQKSCTPNILGMAPPSSSDHQDFYIFRESL